MGAIEVRTKIHLKTSKHTEQILELHSEEEHPLNQLKATEQMLVDSDNNAFVYLASYHDEYQYIYLHEAVWLPLKEAFTTKKKVEAVAGNERLTLNGLHEELDYLIHNIKGNSNYGEDFVIKVEETFLK